MNDIKENLRQFTKEELIEYIATVGFLLRGHSPEEYIFQIRMNRIEDEIDRNLKQTENLISAAKTRQIDVTTFRKRHNVLMDEWHRLQYKRKKTAEKRYPKKGLCGQKESTDGN